MTNEIRQTATDGTDAPLEAAQAPDSGGLDNFAAPHLQGAAATVLPHLAPGGVNQATPGTAEPTPGNRRAAPVTPPQQPNQQPAQQPQPPQPQPPQPQPPQQPAPPAGATGQPPQAQPAPGSPGQAAQDGANAAQRGDR